MLGDAARLSCFALKIPGVYKSLGESRGTQQSVLLCTDLRT
jgi:hypothetical protein